MDAESEVSPAVIKKVLEWHALLGISPEDTRADVLSALAECGWKDDAGRTAEKALSDIGNASKTDADAVLALMAREAASGGLVSPALDGPVSAQPSAADVVEAALAGLPPDLLLSLRAISSARGVEADLRRTLAFFGQHRERLGMLSQGKLPANLLRLAANAAKDIQIQAIQMVAEDPQSADQLAAALALLPTLSTSVPLTAMLPLLPNQLACSVLLPELKKNLENSSNAERMLSLNKWTACGVLISFAEHEALREDAINLYLDLLSKEYEELGVEQGQKLKRKFVEELVKIAVLDGRSFRLLAEWSLSPAAESILQSELVGIFFFCIRSRESGC